LQTDLAPWNILWGHFVFRQVKGQRIYLEDKRRPIEPLDLTLPRIGAFLKKIGIDIRFLHLEELIFQRSKEPPEIIKMIAGRLSFHYGLLALRSFNMATTQGGLQGDMDIDFSTPGIRLDLQWVPAQGLYQLERISLSGGLTSGKGPEQLAGTITLRGEAGSVERAVLTAELGIAPNRLNFKKVSFREKGRKGLVSGEGAVTFDQTGPVFKTLVNLDGLELSRELAETVILSGPIRLEGRPDKYQGEFNLKNMIRSWQTFQLNGTLQGRLMGLEIQLRKGDWLGGALEGEADIRWDKGFCFEGVLRGRRINPEGIKAQWAGLVNLDVQGHLCRSSSGGQVGTITATLLDSQFQKKTLKGGIKAGFKDDKITIEQAELLGPGFMFKGNGPLHERFNVEGQIVSLSTLLPSSQGSIKVGGWGRWRKGLIGGRLNLAAKELVWNGVEAREIHLEAYLDQEKEDSPIWFKTRMHNPSYKSFKADYLYAGIEGSLLNQKITLALDGARGKFRAGLEGAYRDSRWQGSLISVFGTTSPGGDFKLQSPAPLLIDSEGFHLDPCVFIGKGAERLGLKADLKWRSLKGYAALDWQQMDLARISLLGGEISSGRTSGKVDLKWLGRDSIRLQAQVDLAGSLPVMGKAINLSRAGLSVLWDDSGLRSSFNLETLGQGKVWGLINSSEKGRPAIPGQVSVSANWEGLETGLFMPLNASELQADGKWKGQIAGEWSAQSGFSLKGGMQSEGGWLSWKDPERQLKAQIKTAEAVINWTGGHLDGNLSLDLAGNGRMSGRFRLPLTNRFPVRMMPDLPLEVKLQGNIREKGLLSSLLPEASLSGQGRLNWTISATGTWGNPNLTGDMELTEPSVEIKPLGIKVREVLLKGSFRQDSLIISEWKMASGNGTLGGKAFFRLKDWKIAHMEGRISGDHFQFINRPGLEAQANPKLEFSGTPTHLNLTGVWEIPEALITGGQPEGVKRASPDVRLSEVSPSTSKEKVFPLQGEINLVFGEQVRLKAEGLDGSLRGTIKVRIKSTKDIKAFGEVGIVQGMYLLQGQKLQITQGRFVFNGPPDNPGLNILALRTIRGRQLQENWVDEVKAGIMVTGTVQKPLVKLTSQPPMSESDILSTILFDAPLTPGSGQKNLAFLGNLGKTILGEGIKGKVPGLSELDTIEIQADTSGGSRSLVTAGKYLDPRLFLGLGGSLFSNSYQVILRYTLSRHLEVETKGGTTSGGSIYFKVNFD
jgi:translocation and assembly module TamB